MSRGEGIITTSRGMGTFKVRDGTQPIKTPYTLKDGAFAQSDPSVAARLLAESIGWPNMAHIKFVCDQATQAVQGGLKDVYNVMEFLRNKWLILYRLYRGDTLVPQQYGRSQLHSPEPFKAVETLHPRYMRAFFGNQRWFKMIAEGNSHDQNAVAQERLCRDQIRASNFLRKQSTFVRDA